MTGLDEVHAVLAHIATRRRQPEPEVERTASERIHDIALARVAAERAATRRAELDARRNPQEMP